MVHLSSRLALMTPADFNSIPCFSVSHNVPQRGAKLTAFPLTPGASLPCLIGMCGNCATHTCHFLYTYSIYLYDRVGNKTSHVPGRFGCPVSFSSFSPQGHIYRVCKCFPYCTSSCPNPCWLRCSHLIW